MPLEKYTMLENELKCRLQTPYDPREKSSTNQNARIRLIWIKEPTCNSKLMYQRLRHMDKGLGTCGNLLDEVGGGGA